MLVPGYVGAALFVGAASREQQRTPLPADLDGSTVLKRLPGGLGAIPRGIGAGFRCRKVVRGRGYSFLTF